MNLLITGGAGYVGGHTALHLIANGHRVTLLDNLSNSSAGAVAAIRRVAGQAVPFERGDLRDGAFLDGVLEAGRFDAVIHFAALKAVSESVAKPLLYYENNVTGATRLLARMAAHGVYTIVFSSSATVYGNPAKTPITEDFPTAPANPYGRTKLAVEQLLRDVYAADAQPRWRISILRYFNPIGAHPSGEVGESPRGVPSNLLPYLAQVAVGQRERLQVFGGDYPTPDGTCIRDYIHVMDLAAGHARALEHLRARPRLAIHNLGTGRGHSVLEVVRAFEQASGRPIPHRVVARRPGDIPVSYADPGRAREELGWRAERNLAHMCEDVWRWQAAHPRGHDG